MMPVSNAYKSTIIHFYSKTRKISLFLLALFLLLHSAYAAKVHEPPPSKQPVKQAHRLHRVKQSIVKQKKTMTVHKKKILHVVKKKTPIKNAVNNLTKKIPSDVVKVPSTQKHTLVHFVQNLVRNLKFSAYKLGGNRFDARRGVYVVDCSSYVDKILKTVHPRAFAKLVRYSGSVQPTTRDYYHFFNNLTDEPQSYWDTVDDISQLKAGDLLVFRYRDEPENVMKGHIVIVMDQPIRVKDTYRVRISDSAPVRHSHDTRMRRVSGIGIGTMLFKINPKTYQPMAYAWGLNSRWEKNVRFAMARPLELRTG